MQALYNEKEGHYKFCSETHHTLLMVILDFRNKRNEQAMAND